MGKKVKEADSEEKMLALYIAGVLLLAVLLAALGLGIIAILIWMGVL